MSFAHPRAYVVIPAGASPITVEALRRGEQSLAAAEHPELAAGVTA